MAKRELSFQLPIGTTFSANIEDPELVSELTKMYNAINLIALKLDEYTGQIAAPLDEREYTQPTVVNRAVGMNRFYGEAVTDLVSNTLVYFDSTGKLQKATAATGCHAIVLENTTAGNFAPVSRQAVLSGFAGLTPGTKYVVSHAVAGGISTSVPSGNVRQYVGFALTSTILAFYPDNIGVTV